MLEQQVINQPLPMITVAQHPTKVVMHMELVKDGNAEEEVPMLQMAAEAMEETKTISIQESLIQEAWCGWEESLRKV